LFPSVAPCWFIRGWDVQKSRLLCTPDPAKDKMGKVVHLKPKPDQ
jgi:hypothetical protein